MTIAPTIQKYAVHVVLPFILGCCLCGIGRPLSTLIIGDLLQLKTIKAIVRLPEWVTYNLPDGLWLYSFLMWLIMTWQGQKSFEAYVWFLIFIVLAFGSEVLQKLSLLSGTYDTRDVLAYFIALFLCAFNYYHQNTIPK